MGEKRELRARIESLTVARDEYQRHLRGVIVERDEAVRGRDGWRSTAKVVADQRDEARAELVETREHVAQVARERNGALDQRDKAQAEVRELRAELAQARLDLLDPTPEPRPFRVGDRVKVAEGATYRAGPNLTLVSRSAGWVGVVSEVWGDGDLIIETEAESFCAASPEFCTLIEDEPEPDDDTPTPQPVTLILPDGTRVTFDAVVTR